jgi:hypothetical protein
MLSLWLCTKVITLSSFHCIAKYFTVGIYYTVSTVFWKVVRGEFRATVEAIASYSIGTNLKQWYPIIGNQWSLKI